MAAAVARAVVAHFTMAEIAGRYRVNIRTVYEWVKAKKFPRPIRVQRKLLCPVSVIEEFEREASRA
jgi:hypothetical protein